MKLFPIVGFSFVCSLVMPATSVVVADDKFPLADSVPQNVFLMVAARHNPEREFLDKAWGEVMDELAKSGVGEEIWKLMTSSGGTKQKADADEDDEEDGDEDESPKKGNDKLKEAAEKIHKLAGDVDWEDLGKREFVMCGRMKSPMPDFVFMFRGTKEGTARNYKAFGAFLDEIQTHAGDKLKFTADKSDGVERRTVSAHQAPFAWSLCRRGDVLMIAQGDELLNEVLGLMDGKSDTKPLVATERYKDAFKKLPAAEDELAFFDMSQMVKGMNRMFDDIGKMTQDDEQGRKMMKLMRTIMDDMCVMDYSATTVRTDGMRVFADEWIALVPDAKKKPTYAIFVPDGEIEKFDKYVPTEAVGFSVSRGMQLKPLHDYIATLVREKVPNGEKAWEHVEAFQQEIGLNLDKDLFSWLGNEWISVELPSGGPLGGDSVMMISVKDAEKATSKIRAGISAIGKRFPVGESPCVTTSPTKVGGTEGFFTIEIHHPMMAMMAATLQPVWGVHDGYLFLSSSKGAIAKCLKTASGDHDSIVKSERFRKEALMPESGAGKLIGVSFSDTTSFAEDMQTVLGQFGMIGMFANFNPAMKEAGAALGAMSSIAQKLIPVVAKMNFFLSDASYQTFHSNGWHVRTVSNYRKPPKSAPKDDEDWDDDWGDQDKKKAGDTDDKSKKDDAPKAKKDAAKSAKDDDDDDDN